MARKGILPEIALRVVDFLVVAGAVISVVKRATLLETALREDLLEEEAVINVVKRATLRETALQVVPVDDLEAAISVVKRVTLPGIAPQQLV